MADLIVTSVEWKKGETGNQRIIVYDSDGVTKHILTGHTYTFKVWKEGDTTNKINGASLTIIDAPNGELEYAVQSADTNTVDYYSGEVLETDTGLKTKTFAVAVYGSAPQ